MFCALGVMAAGILVIFIDDGFLQSSFKLAPQHPQYLVLVARLLITAVVALPLSVWLFFRADRLRRRGRVGLCVIAVILVVLNLELASVIFAAAALVASIWLLRRLRPNLAQH